MVTEHQEEEVVNTFGDEVRVFPLDQSQRDEHAAQYKRHILICADKRDGGCLSKGSKDVQKTFQHAVIEDHLDKVKVSAVNSLGFCERGPTVVVYPEGIWYEDLTPAKAEDIIEGHIRAGEPLSEYRFDPGLPEDFHHFVVCVFMANCAKANGGKLARYLQSRAQDTPNVKVTMSNGCLKECSMGPVCCSYPGGEWYTGVKESQYEEVWKNTVESDQSSIFKTGKIKNE